MSNKLKIFAKDFFSNKIPHILFLLSLFSSSLISQTVNLDASTTGSTIYTCDMDLFDSGGPSGNYKASENYKITICPTDSIESVIAFNTGISYIHWYDTLIVYQGKTDDPSKEFYRMVGPAYSLQATGMAHGGLGYLESDGCLTIKFVTDAAGHIHNGFATHFYCKTRAELIYNNNDDICNAIELPLGNEPTEGTTFNHTSGCLDNDMPAPGGILTSAAGATYWFSVSWYKFTAPNGKNVNVNFTNNYDNDEVATYVYPYMDIFYLNDCDVTSCSEMNSTDLTRQGNYNLGNNSVEKVTAVNNLVPGRTYYIRVHNRQNTHAQNSNNNYTTWDCSTVGVYGFNFEIDVEDTNPCEDDFGNTVNSPFNDDYCAPEDLGIECNSSKGSNICSTGSDCAEPASTVFGEPASYLVTNSVWYRYIPDTLEIDKVHKIIFSGLTCENNTVNRISYALLEIDTAIASCDAIASSQYAVLSNGGYHINGTPNDVLSFSASAGKYYMVGVDVYNHNVTSGCEFDMEIDVYDKFVVNGGGYPEYECEFPEGPGANLSFFVEGGRESAQKTVIFSTTGTDVVAYWTEGDRDTAAALTDTVYGQSEFLIEGLMNGDEWSVSFDDGLGCGYSYSGTYSYKTHCDVCEKLSKLNIDTETSSVCPDVPVTIEPKANVVYPVPFMVSADIDYYKRDVVSGINYRWLYDNPTTKLLSTSATSFGTSDTDVAVQEICFRMFAYTWDYFTVKMTTPCDGGGGTTWGGATEKTITLWQGAKNGGSDKATGPGGWNAYGYGWMKFCTSTGWENQTMGAKLSTTWDSKDATSVTNAFKTCNPNDGVNFIVERARGWGYVQPRDVNVTLVDRKDAISSKFKDNRAIEWTTRGIGDLSELTFPQTEYEDTLKHVAIFQSATPGEYRYDLIGYSDIGCQIGDNINHGGPTGDGTFRINVHEPPTINSITAKQNITNICIGKKIELKAAITAGTNEIDPTAGYLWEIISENDNAYLTTKYTNTTYVQTEAEGLVLVKLTLIDGEGCSTSSTVTLNINPDCKSKPGSFN